jgi:hypothetical protein
LFPLAAGNLTTTERDCAIGLATAALKLAVQRQLSHGGQREKP